jgi:hypothetical protein
MPRDVILKGFWILPTERSYVFFMIPRKTANTSQNSANGADLCNWDILFFLFCILYDVEAEFLQNVYTKYIIQCVEVCNILLKSVPN